MQTAHASGGEVQAEDSNISHLSAESQVFGVFGRSGSLRTSRFLNPHARVKSAPPARARKAVGNDDQKLATAAWIPSIPGRIAHGSAPSVPTLRIYSGSTSVASSRVPSSKARQPPSADLAAETAPHHASHRMPDTDASSSPQPGPQLSKEISLARACNSNFLNSPRSNWKSDDAAWSKLTERSQSARQGTRSSRARSAYGVADRPGHTQEAHIPHRESQTVQTEDGGFVLPQINDVRNSSSQTDVLSRAVQSLNHSVVVQSAEDVIKNFKFARRRLTEIQNGERTPDLPAEYPHLCHMPVMKGKLCPAVLMRQHHLKGSDVAMLYEAIHLFSFEFHKVIEDLTASVTHSLELKQSVWLALAEVWQAGLCVQFPSDVQVLLEERDQAVKTAQSAAAECRQLHSISAGMTEQHGMLASKAAERLQAEDTLKLQKGSLEGEVAMLTQAKETLAHRVAQLTKDVGVAETLAEDRLRESKIAGQQAMAFKKVVEAQSTQLSQKTKLLGSQWSEIQRLQKEKHGLCQQLEDFGSEDKVQELKMRLRVMDQDAEALRKDAQLHGKKTALLKTQITALQIKLKEATAENSALDSAYSAAHSKAEEYLIASRKFEAEASALAHKLENERMRQADIEAQAWHAISRRNDIVQAYQPLLKRVHAAESMQHNAQIRVDAVTQEMDSLRSQLNGTLLDLTQLQSEQERLKRIEEQHFRLQQQHTQVQVELKDVLNKTRPLRVLIAFKRHQVQSLNHQLADLLELHADSAAKARTAQGSQQAPRGRDRLNPRHTHKVTLDDENSDQGNESVKELEQQSQHLQQQLVDSTQQLDVAVAELAAARIEIAGKEEVLQEYVDLTSQLKSKLAKNQVSISNLHDCKEQLEKELAQAVDAMSSAENRFADECECHKACQEECSKIRNDLQEVQEDVKANLEASSLQHQVLEQRVTEYEQLCASMVAAILVRCNGIQQAWQDFGTSCVPFDRTEAKQKSNGDLFTSVLEKLHWSAVCKHQIADQESPATEEVPDVSLKKSILEGRTAGALERLASVMQHSCDTLSTLTKLDLTGLARKKDEEAAELIQRLKDLEEYSRNVCEDSVRLGQELDSALMKLQESERAVEKSEKDRLILAEQQHRLQERVVQLEQEVDTSVLVSDAQKVELDSLQSQCDRLQSVILSTTERCQRSEADAQTAAGLMKALEDQNIDLKARLASLEADNSHLYQMEKSMKNQLAEADANLKALQKHAKDHEDAAFRLQGTCNALEEELDSTFQERDHVQRQEAQANIALAEVKEQLAVVQGTLQDTQQSWMNPEVANSLRLEAQRWQEKHAKVEHRYRSLLDDFEHLSERKGFVETERRRQHEYRCRIAALCAGLEQVQRGMSELEDRCCNVTQTGSGIVRWAENCMEFAEGMKQAFVDALVEHDAMITRADLPGLHVACLSALRHRTNRLEDGQPAVSAPQHMSVKRMEERVEQLRNQLVTKQEMEHTLRATLQGLEKENSTLQQNNAELRDELSICDRTAGAAEAASAEARELRARVDQLTAMHQSLFGRMLRLAALATEKQKGTTQYRPGSGSGACDEAADVNDADLHSAPKQTTSRQGSADHKPGSTVVPGDDVTLQVTDGVEDNVGDDSVGDAAATPSGQTTEEPEQM